MWEYFILRDEYEQATITEQVLNEYGRGDWELVSTYFNDQGIIITAILKRKRAT